jgi:hypothetical protein
VGAVQVNIAACKGEHIKAIMRKRATYRYLDIGIPPEMDHEML